LGQLLALNQAPPTPTTSDRASARQTRANAMQTKLRLLLLLVTSLAAVQLLACVEELGGGGVKQGFCDATGEEGEGASCESDADCQGGLRCYRQGNDRFCVVPCAGNDDCGGSACNLPEDDDNNGENNDGSSNSSSNNPNSENNENNENNVDPNNENNVDPNNENNVDPNNENNVDPNNENNFNNQNNTNNGGGECAEACDYLGSCLDEICSQPVLDPDACLGQCEQDPGQFVQLLQASCEELNGSLCQANPQLGQVCECPGSGPGNTNAGAACESDADCEADTLPATCIPETSPEDNTETGFAGGYCTAIGCQSDDACGAGNFCLQVAEDGTTACIAGCQSQADCRDGYACNDLTGGQQPGAASVCFPACTTDADCGEGTCNDDGTCSP
jgi:hypothetical protein